MNVPKDEETVGPQTLQVPTPQFSAAPEAAFGGAVKEASAKLGLDIQKGGEVLAEHVARENYYRMIQSVQENTENFKKAAQNLVYGDPNEPDQTVTKKTPDGKDYDVPAGILQRTMNQADGSTAEYDQRMAALRKQYVGAIKNPRAAALFSRSVDAVSDVYRGHVISNEAKQRSASYIHTMQSSLINQTENAADARNTEELKVMITGDGGIEQTNNRLGLYRGEDPETLQKNKMIWAGKAVDKAATAMLEKTGDLTAAQDMLDGVKDLIDTDKYDAINTKLEKGSEVIKRQIVRQKNETEIGNSLDLIRGLSHGQVGWQDLDKIDDMQISEQTKMAFKAAIESKSLKTDQGVNEKKIGYVPTKDKAFAKHMADMIKSPDQEGMINVMNEALHGFGKGTISQDRLNILAKLVLQRSKSMPTTVRDTDAVEHLMNPAPIAQNSGPQQTPVDAGLKSLTDWQNQTGIKDDDIYNNYLNEITKGSTPKDAHDAAIKAAVIKKYPQAVNMQNVPNMVVDGSGKARKIFPRENNQDEPDKIYNPSTKKMEPNPKKKQAEKKKAAG